MVDARFAPIEPSGSGAASKIPGSRVIVLLLSAALRWRYLDFQTAMTTRTKAQGRADAIEVFRKELASLETEGVLRLSPEQREALTRHHDRLLTDYAREFDIDRDVRSRQLSWGMRIASLLGALALAASVYFLFKQFWGAFPDTVQVGVLVVATLGTFGATLVVQSRDPTGYFTKLAAMVAFACFVLNITLLGQIYNITPSDKALLPWAAFALMLAYLCDLRLLLGAGLLCIVAFIAARAGSWGGIYWIHFGERPENFFPAAAAIFALPLLVRHARFDQFPPVYRLVGLLALFLPVLVLSHWGRGSYVDLPPKTVEGFYQIIGFAFSAGALWLGLRRQWAETTHTGIVFFVIFLYTKFYDWWWELLPKYLFFLVLGLTAVLILLMIRRLRVREGNEPEPSP